MKRLKSLLGILILAQTLSLPAIACWGDGCGGRFPPGMNIQLLRSRLKSEAQISPPSKEAAPAKPVKAKAFKKKEEPKKAPKEKTGKSPRDK